MTSDTNRVIADRNVANRSVTRRLAWVATIVVGGVLLAFGSVRDSGPLTQQERIDVITKRIACPTCNTNAYAQPADKPIPRENIRKILQNAAASTQTHSTQN